MTTETVNGEVMSTSVTIAPALDSRQTLALQLHDPTKLDMLWQMYPTMTQLDMDVLIEKCRSTGLNPWKNEIYPIERGTGKNRKVTYQTSIEGYRKIAFESGQYDGMEGPWWCGEDGVWKEVWLADEPPMAAKVTMYRKDVSRGFTSIALWKEYVQTTAVWENNQRTGETRVTDMWATKGASQLAKCAESLNHRKMSPNLYGGIYTAEEMGQADNYTVTVEEPPKVSAPARREALAKATAQAETNTQLREQQARQHNEAPATMSDEPPESDKHMKMIAALPEWMAPLYAVLVDQNRKLSELSVILGRPASAKALRDWASALPEDVDPFAEMLRLCREHGIIPKPRQESLTDWAPVDAVDPETGEVVPVAEGEAVPEGFVPVPDEDDAVFE